MTLFPLLAGGSVGEIAADADRNRQVLRHERWHRAAAHGAAGHVARADTELEMLRDEATRAGDTALESLCLSTRASLLRQAGRHDRALVSDARALAAIGLPGPAGAADGRWAFAARMDALVGLAADNLGRFAFGASERLLRRARSLMAAAAPDAGDWECALRPMLRCEWVSAELDLYRGEPAAARIHAQAGLDLLAELPAQRHTRHRMKTDLIAAAVDAATGDAAAAVERGQACRRAAADAGLLPLQWAATALLGSLVSDPGVAVEYRSLHAELTRRGMSFGR